MNEPCDHAEHDRRARELVAACLAKLAPGTSLSEEFLVDQHPDLAKEIHAVVQELVQIDGAIALADAQRSGALPADDDETPDAEDTSTYDGGLPSATTATPPEFAGYELLKEIGRGGMGVVYRARQVAADRLVALKVIRPERLLGLSAAVAQDPIIRFQIEARAAARLHHEHVVDVYEVGEHAGQPFYSMRLVEGRSLAAVLRGGPLAARRAAAYLEPVARAVHHAHQHGVLHRDLKPQNILLETATDRLLVTDFGLAKIVEGGSDATLAGAVFGTPPYMSPEQATDASQVTVASDV